MNPDYIGVSVLEKTVEYEDIDEVRLINNDYYKVIDVRQYDLSYYSQKTSSHWLSILMNGRRKQEIALIFKQIFNIARHYACAYFVMEDLSFNNSKKKSKEANRKINNLWHLKLTKH